MDGKIDLFTLIALIIAVVVILRLRSVLGRRTGDEEGRLERYRAAQQRRQAGSPESQAGDKVVALPRRDRDRDEPQPAATTVLPAAEAEARVKAFAGGNEPIEKGLQQILALDSAFVPDEFVRGAKQAYEMIVTAYAEGNRKILKNLLSPDVYEGFSSAIQDRENRGEQIDQSFVGISKADVLEAEMKGGTANLTVRFISQLITATRDKAGVILSGDAQRVAEVTDIWTFSRDISSARARQNPNWRLVATQSQN